jgi:hypothetical protein
VKYFLVGLAILASLPVLFLLAVRLFMRRARNSPEFHAAFARYQASREAEDATIELADWFGTTGLADEVERELPRYLRRELGESFLDEDSLKAGDLQYVGKFSNEGGLPIHFWKVPYRDQKDVYAYVEVWPDGQPCTGWGNKEPPL